MSGCFGLGEAIGHAGEILQGSLDGNCFLVTLPAPGLLSVSHVYPASDWSVVPSTKSKALRAAQMACAAWSESRTWSIRIESGIPEGRGYGSSTADCVSVVRALADATGRVVTDEETASIVHSAEAASDPTMFGLEPVVFLSRRGVMLRRIEGDWPEAHITVFDLGGPPIETLAAGLPKSPAYEPLLRNLEAAFRARDLRAIAEIATASALLLQAHRPHSAWDGVYLRSIHAGALGVAVAHTGNIAAAISQVELDIPAAYRYRLAAPETGARSMDNRRREPAGRHR